MGTSERELMIKISGKVDNSMNTIANKVDKEFQRMQRAAKTLGVAGAAALTGITTAAVNVGKEYEAQMSTVEAISGASADEMARLEKMAQEMGATTKFTATESGQAMEYMAMAGWKSEQMLGGIEGIMELAAASGEDLATVSDIVTDALTAFNLTAEDSGHFADVLAKASSSSNTNVAMMGETFKYVAPVAGALKYSIEDTAVSIGLMANAGIKASQGGTTLRKIMNETAGGVELVSKAYAKNGEKTGKLKIEAANADGSMKDWSVTIGKLRKEFSKMTDEEKAANAESIAGKTAMAGLLAIVNASDADYKKLTQEINNAAGATKKMSDIRMDNLEGDITLFQSALQGKGIELYKEIKEPLRDLVQDATDWLGEIDVAKVVDEFKDFGGAVVDFAEPLINVGEWMLDNPEAIAGPLAGIGGTIVGYKLFDTISETGKGLEMLGASLTASPWITGGALAVGALAGTIAAIETTQRKMEAASLEKHFGEISLSMEQVQAAADHIIGSRKLEAVGSLLSSMEISEGLLKDMDEASENIKKIDWKLSVGLKLSDDDMDEYEKNVQEYIASAQSLIEEKGYSVSVATNVLFDGEAGWETTKQNNDFYAHMDEEAGKLSEKINKKLKKAMKDGLTLDLQEEIDGLLNQMSEITNAMTEAENESSWEVLKTDFSGKDLDADSFGELQERINDNIDKIDEGSKAAYDETITNLLAQKKMGYLSDTEYDKRKTAAEEAYQKQKDDARQKGLEFQYNTLMDTYGEQIASGNYEDGDKRAIQEIIAPMMETANTVDAEMYGKLQSIRAAAEAGRQSSVLSYINGLFAVGNDGGEVWRAAIDPEIAHEADGNVYKTINKDAQEAANTYLNQKAEEEYAKFWDELPQEGKEVFKPNIDFASVLLNPAKEGGQKAGAEIENAIQKELSKGIQANVPITLSGSFSFNGSAPVGETGNKTKGQKTSGKTGGAATLFPPITGHAAGIISNKEHIAAVSEGNKTEAIIPIDGSERSRRLYEATGKLMGAASQPPVTFAPHIEVNVSGNASSVDAKKIGAEVEKAAERAYRKMMRDEKRFRMG